MTVKFSPGPWVIGVLDRNGQRVVRSEHIEIATCWHHSVRSIELEMEANANLIAVAPEMYWALLKIQNEIGMAPNESLFQVAKQVLKKARGE